jgi:sulfur transfer protein SufE
MFCNTKSNSICRFFICFRGSPIHRSCANGLWFDVVNNWCTTADEVTCDGRTSNNPNEVESTTVEVTTMPRDPPELSICDAVSHLFNPVTGSYMKSSCIVRGLLTYEQGEQTCQASNMNLFIIDDSFVQSTFFTATTNVVGEWYANGFLWINGRREATGEWMTSDPAQAPLYSGVDWVETEEIDGRTSGDCLQYSSIHTPYRAMGSACDALMYPICEFHSEPELNTNECLYNTELADDDGNYLKSSCIINQVKSHWEAEEYCRDNGMHLFAINNSTVASAFHTSTSDLLLSRPSGHVWINGRRESDEWFVYDPIRAQIYAGVEWLETDTIDGRTSGECLQHDTRYWAKGEDCDDRAWFICEY